MIAIRHEDVRRLFLEQRETQKEETLRRVAANLVAKIEQKTAERDKWLAEVGTAKDADIVAALVEKAEAASKEAREAQDKLAELRPALDSLNAQDAAFEYTMARLSTYTTMEQLDALPLQEKRFLLDLVGLKLTVYPSGTKLDNSSPSGRISVGYKLRASGASLL